MLTASAAMFLVAAGYAALCAAKPFGPCRTCKGTGLRELRRAVKVCRRCHGSRYRLRIGRRLWNTWHRTRTAGTKPNRHGTENAA
ncbi:hypothetical protein [Streptomyces sp. RKCA744]|uniref:hypothetical protein n=1 Tax=Streptomyces sp. RKCA744 TaxID=2959340 RepID=UPI0020A18D8E|nr:hypothetical protein [Streptomyces sp. RKCA744]MCO8302826.1 hypothetical protein [Streptomyces sp. RKCA744]